MAKSWKKTCFDVGKLGFCHCASVLQTQVPKLCTTLDLGLLYILIFGTYSKFARKNNFLALGVCFPHLCSSRRWPQDYRVKITFRKLPANRFVSTTKRSMKYVVNWIPLRIRVRSRNTQPHLKDSKIMLHIECSLCVPKAKSFVTWACVRKSRFQHQTQSRCTIFVF